MLYLKTDTFFAKNSGFFLETNIHGFLLSYYYFDEYQGLKTSRQETKYLRARFGSDVARVEFLARITI